MQVKITTNLTENYPHPTHYDNLDQVVNDIHNGQFFEALEVESEIKYKQIKEIHIIL